MKHIAKLTAFLFLLFLSKIILAQNTGPQQAGDWQHTGCRKQQGNTGCGVTIMLLSYQHTGYPTQNANGEFILDKLGFGFYRLRVTAVGYSALLIDSIHIRAERFDFDLNDIKLKKMQQC
jgi:hypothetical protein